MRIIAGHGKLTPYLDTFNFVLYSLTLADSDNKHGEEGTRFLDRRVAGRWNKRVRCLVLHLVTWSPTV